MQVIGTTLLAFTCYYIHNVCLTVTWYGGRQKLLHIQIFMKYSNIAHNICHIGKALTPHNNFDIISNFCVYRI